MIRQIDNNGKFIVQKVVNVKVRPLDEIREAVVHTLMRYQVFPVDQVGDASACRCFDTLTEARRAIA